jgi:hypothetical protein
MMATGLFRCITGREPAKERVAVPSSAMRRVLLLGHGGTADRQLTLCPSLFLARPAPGDETSTLARGLWPELPTEIFAPRPYAETFVRPS